MQRRCRKCLCKTCLHSCKCKTCTKEIKVRECNKYIKVEQVKVFEESKQNKSAPRYSWNHYGISKERYRKLSDMVCSGRYASVTQYIAHTANEMLSEYILLSVTKNLSYEGIENAEGLGRIPCGRTDFYGWRRYFYHLLDQEIKEVEKKQ